MRHSWRVGDPPLTGLDPETSFAEKVKTVNLGFTYGRDQFHGATITERAERQISEAKAAGLKPEPCGARWV